MNTTNPNPSPWRQYWTQVGNQDWLAARRLLDLSPRVSGYYSCYLTADLDPSHADEDGHSHTDEGGHQRTRRLPQLQLDWQAAASRVDAEGFSSTQRRLARLVAALTTGHPVDLQDLSQLGSWSVHVWAILAEWGTDGAATIHPTHHDRVDEPIHPAHRAGHDEPTRNGDNPSDHDDRASQAGGR